MTLRGRGRVRSKARMLGTCFVCGRPVFGRRTLSEEQARHMAGPAVRVPGEGVRHNRATCTPAPPGHGAILET